MPIKWLFYYRYNPYKLYKRNSLQILRAQAIDKRVQTTQRNLFINEMSKK